MDKKVLLVGHCGPDSSYLRMAINSAAREAKVQAKLLAADDEQELKDGLTEGPDLILFNRELGYGFDDHSGVAVIGRLRAQHPDAKMMLVSNYPDAQQAAVAAGALPGFGKREIGSPKVVKLLGDALT